LINNDIIKDEENQKENHLLNDNEIGRENSNGGSPLIEKGKDGEREVEDGNKNKLMMWNI